MKTIAIPAPIYIEKAGKDISFQEFLGLMLRDAKFATGMNTVLSACKIQQRMESASDALHMDESEHSLLQSVVESPSGGYNPLFAMELAPFMIAVRDAKDS